jgi:hypothetical protein
MVVMQGIKPAAAACNDGTIGGFVPGYLTMAAVLSRVAMCWIWSLDS